MNTKTKGDIAESRALYEFIKRKIPVCLPFGDNQRYDMIAEFNGKLNRIQVKMSNEEDRGSIICYARSSTNHTTNKRLSGYEGEVDYFVFYNMTRDIIALVPIEELNGSQIVRLRVEPAGSINQYKVRYFSDYTFDKILDV
jgi:hypothetical protein